MTASQSHHQRGTVTTAAAHHHTPLTTHHSPPAAHHPTLPCQINHCPSLPLNKPSPSLTHRAAARGASEVD
ncbi:hypothetical protein E2C01_072884 [Portunus trituberculatus]|uniref:Uncharacterized protein n=1 Tax=Portunus trituberculatus TaxID=210409 RepID=A0A5B7I935_PORTR|nr:hypothetical protein [Portunus trituberculatus]